MKTNTVALLLPLLLPLAVSCSKESETKTETPEAKTEGKTETKDVKTNGEEPTAKSDSSFIKPIGEGPHTGFDLEGIHKKLQGTWLFGKPGRQKVWHIEGSKLTLVNQKGEQSEHTIELLAPCYAKVAEKGGGSSTYVHYVFDGDELYYGLGNAGLVLGDKTIGCMSVTMFVSEGGKCTAWKKKSGFGRKGTPTFETVEGTCGFEEEVFFGEAAATETNKGYGKQKLTKRSGDALLSSQMNNNKGEKLASLEAAIAKHKEGLE